ncbi:MAG: caspase family protein [Rhodobacteraceae bacterium]|nr:caspase family protein [Paracoccaceae bacterium]
MLKLVYLTVFLIAAPVTPAQATEIHALIIGVDEYQSQPDLKGAVNDAKDIAQSVRQFGASQVRLLLNDEASRANIDTIWRDMIDGSDPGDTIIFSFAGHGRQEDDANGDERLMNPLDDKDEVLLLSRFNINEPAGLKERLLDDDLHIWFVEAQERGVQVLFVVDSCFSGGLTRSVLGGQAPGQRLANPFAIPKTERERLSKKPPPQHPEETLSNLVMITGGREGQTVPEILVGGTFRGATSYAFARALEGNADRDHNEVLTRNELRTYISQTVQNLTTQHRPSILPRGGEDFAVLAGAAAQNSKSVEAIVTEEVNPQDLSSNELAPDTSTLYLDTPNKDIRIGPDQRLYNSEGDIVAYDVTESSIKRITDKFRLVDALKSIAIRESFNVAVLKGGTPSDSFHNEGDVLSLVAGPLPYQYLTVFNLANGGEVQSVFPFEDDDREAGPNHLQSVNHIEGVQIAPPFGSDHVVFLSSHHNPLDLRAAIAEQATASQVENLLRQTLKNTHAAAAIAPIYTREN